MSRLSNAVAVIPPAHDPDWNPYLKRENGWFEVNGAGFGPADYGPMDEEDVLWWVDEHGFQIVEAEE